MTLDIVVYWINEEDFPRRASAFLDEHHPSREIPIPIEDIVEELGIDIVPIPGMRESYDIDALLSSDGTQISVDDYVYNKYENRYRFSLAHELGHRVLHSSIMEKLTFDTLGQWKKLSQEFPENPYRQMGIRRTDSRALCCSLPLHWQSRSRPPRE